MFKQISQFLSKETHYKTGMDAGASARLMKRFVFLLAVLAAGLPPDRALPDSGRVLRSGPPSLPQQRLESDQDGNLLLRGGHQRDSCVPLGLAE